METYAQGLAAFYALSTILYVLSLLPPVSICTRHFLFFYPKPHPMFCLSSLFIAKCLVLGDRAGSGVEGNLRKHRVKQHKIQHNTTEEHRAPKRRKAFTELRMHKDYGWDGGGGGGTHLLLALVA